MPSRETSGCRLQLNAWQAVTSPDSAQIAALEALEGREAKRIRAAMGCLADIPMLTDAPLSSLNTGDVLDVRLLVPPAAAGKDAGNPICCTLLGSKCA